MKAKKPSRKPKRRPTKGALIRGASKPLSREFLNSPTFREGLSDAMKGYSGLYALYHHDRIYYIGLANNLFWRLHQHTKDRHKSKWDHFAVFRIARVRYLKDIESLLLRVANPPGNKVRGKFYNKADMMKPLKRLLNAEARRMKRMQRAFMKPGQHH